MKPAKVKKIRSDIAKDLMDFKSCLTSVLEDSSPFESAISELYKSTNTLTWNYSIDELILVVKNPDYRHVRPKDAQLDNNLKVCITTSVVGHCGVWDANYDVCSFEELSFKVKIYHRSDLFQTAFHLDICNPNEALSGESHPTFHLQFKPNVENDDSFEYGNVLELDTPRFSHPPMELILGLDFIFSNFVPNLWTQLHENGTYLNILRKYQQALWYPYFARINSFWQSQFGEVKDRWHPQALLPNLVNRHD